MVCEVARPQVLASWDRTPAIARTPISRRWRAAKSMPTSRRTRQASDRRRRRKQARGGHAREDQGRRPQDPLSPAQATAATPRYAQVCGCALPSACDDRDQETSRMRCQKTSLPPTAILCLGPPGRRSASRRPPCSRDRWPRAELCHVAARRARRIDASGSVKPLWQGADECPVYVETGQADWVLTSSASARRLRSFPCRSRPRA